MKFSLICATINRSSELERLISSIQGQTHMDYELIIVDQNDDDRLIPIIDSFSGEMKIKRIKSEKGLSKARNAGLEIAIGDIIGFPDDDCWYSEQLLENIHEWMIQNPDYAGISGMCFDDLLGRSYGRVSQHEGILTKYNVWLKGSSASLFLKQDFIERNQLRFDENLGLGSPNFSGEETDFILQMMDEGAHIYYSPGIKVGHPYKKEVMDEKMILQGYNYGLGFGLVLKKHKYPQWFAILVFARSVSGMFFELLRFRINWIKYHYNTLLGRMTGYRYQGRSTQ